MVILILCSILLIILFIQEIGFTHMRILEGVGTLVQLGGLIARLCKMVRTARHLSYSYEAHLLSEHEPKSFQNIIPHYLRFSSRVMLNL